MIKPVSGMIAPGESPVAGSSKQCVTPLRTSRKLCRRDQGAADVHTACSTPNRMHATRNLPSSWNSPSDSIPCSQEHRPDVIWDYTSPKLPKGARKREIKITVEEFLKNLNHNKAPECNTQNSNYIKLLEKWMAKQNTPVCVKKPVRVIKRDHKMRSRRVFEEIKQFMETIQQNNNIESKEQNEKEDQNENILPGSPENKKPLLDGDTTENDSLEELWGEADNSFIVKATQHLDVSCLKYDTQCKNKEIISTIPETIPNTSSETKNKNCRSVDNSESDPFSRPVIDSEQQAQILLTQIMNCDWESDSDFEDFENGFIMGDDDLSLIPEEILSGVPKKQDDKSSEETSQLTAKMSSSSTSSDKILFDSKNNCSEISFGCSDTNKISSKADNMSEIELFNNFDDESFGDESILCQPEVLSLIDEVESKLSQSQKLSSELSQAPKCSPEEIKKKKAEAVQRRKRNMSRNRK